MEHARNCRCQQSIQVTSVCRQVNFLQLILLLLLWYWRVPKLKHIDWRQELPQRRDASCKPKTQAKLGSADYLQFSGKMTQ